MSSPQEPRPYRPGGEPGGTSEFTPAGGARTTGSSTPPTVAQSRSPDEAQYPTQAYPAQSSSRQDEAAYRPGQYDVTGQAHADSSQTGRIGAGLAFQNADIGSRRTDLGAQTPDSRDLRRRRTRGHEHGGPAAQCCKVTKPATTRPVAAAALKSWPRSTGTSGSKSSTPWPTSRRYWLITSSRTAPAISAPAGRDAQQRQLVTIGMLIALCGCEPQLEVHINARSTLG